MAVAAAPSLVSMHVAPKLASIYWSISFASQLRDRSLKHSENAIIERSKDIELKVLNLELMPSIDFADFAAI